MERTVSHLVVQALIHQWIKVTHIRPIQHHRQRRVHQLQEPQGHLQLNVHQVVCINLVVKCLFNVELRLLIKTLIITIITENFSKSFRIIIIMIIIIDLKKPFLITKPKALITDIQIAKRWNGYYARINRLLNLTQDFINQRLLWTKAQFIDKF